jgi:hypothetical protein
LAIIARALLEYRESGKTLEDFEMEFGCEIILDKSAYGIADIKFHNDSYETLFMLKYNT